MLQIRLPGFKIEHRIVQRAAGAGQHALLAQLLHGAGHQLQQAARPGAGDGVGLEVGFLQREGEHQRLVHPPAAVGHPVRRGEAQGHGRGLPERRALAQPLLGGGQAKRRGQTHKGVVVLVVGHAPQMLQLPVGPAQLADAHQGDGALHGGDVLQLVPVRVDEAGRAPVEGRLQPERAQGEQAVEALRHAGGQLEKRGNLLRAAAGQVGAGFPEPRGGHFLVREAGLAAHGREVAGGQRAVLLPPCSKTSGPVGAARVRAIRRAGWRCHAQGGGIVALDVVAPRKLPAPVGQRMRGKIAALLLCLQGRFGLGELRGGEQRRQLLLQPVGGDGLERRKARGRPGAGDRLARRGNPSGRDRGQAGTGGRDRAGPVQHASGQRMVTVTAQPAAQVRVGRAALRQQAFRLDVAAQKGRAGLPCNLPGLLGLSGIKRAERLGVNAPVFAAQNLGNAVGDFLRRCRLLRDGRGEQGQIEQNGRRRAHGQQAKSRPHRHPPGGGDGQTGLHHREVPIRSLKASKSSQERRFWAGWRRR